MAETLRSPLPAPPADPALVRSWRQQLAHLQEQMSHLQSEMRQADQEIAGARRAVLEADRDAAILEQLLARSDHPSACALSRLRTSAPWREHV